MSLYSTTIRETKVEFKSYGLYSDVAEIAKKQGLAITVDQVEKIYNWYAKNTIGSLLEGNCIQANLRGLGKIKFHARRGMSALNINIQKITSLLEYYDKVEEKISDVEELKEKKYRIYLVVKNNYKKLTTTSENYIKRLNKMHDNEGISTVQYEFNLKRYNDFSQKLNTLYEPIQRILRTHEEGN